MDKTINAKRAKISPEAENNSGEAAECFNAGKSLKILDLPKEVLSSLLTWIPQPDKVRSRLVCKDWKQNVDLHATFNIKLFGNVSPDLLKRMLELRINTIEFSSLQNHFELNLAFPLLVKEVIISTNVSPQNFKTICEVCRDIQVLRFLSTFNSDKTFDPQQRDDSLEMLRSLKRLKEIEIGIVSFGARPIGSCETFNVIFNNNLKLPFGNLNSLNITLQLYHSEMYVFFEFLVKQSVTLKHLSVRLDCPRINTADNNATYRISDAPWYSQLSKNLKLKSLQVMRDLGTCRICEQLEQVWRDIIESQRLLTNLVVDLNKDFTVQELLQVLSSNPHLESLKVFGIHCDIGDDIQEDAFEKNYKLVELFLEFNGNTCLIVDGSSGEVQEQKFEFKAILHLPTTLQKLTVKRSLIRPEYLCNSLNRLKKLKELHLEDCLFRNEPVDLEAFLGIFKILGSSENNIQRFTFDGFNFPAVSSRSFSTTSQEVEEEASSQINLWNDIMRIAVDRGILKLSGRHFSIPLIEEPCQLVGSNDIYDFIFTKQQINEFIRKVENSHQD